MPIFYRDWWLDVVCSSGQWDVAMTFDGGGKVTGILPFFKQRIKGIKLISNPPLTPYLGILFFYPSNQASRTARYSFEQRIIKDLEEQLPKNIWYKDISFSPSYNNWLPFYWKKYQQRVRYTYILEEIKNEENLIKNLSNTLSRQINKAKKSHDIIEKNDVDNLYRLQDQSLKRQGLKTPFSKGFLNNLVQELEKRDLAKMLFAIRKNTEQCEAAMLLVLDHDRAYCLLLGMDSKDGGHDASKLLLWESILKASKWVDIYDFEGSMIEGVERVYRSFGSIRTSFYNIIWFRNKWVNALFSIMKR